MSYCNEDQRCKGYVQKGIHCQIATTSTCPTGCSGPYDVGNQGELVSDGTCGENLNFGGCFVKEAST